MINIKNIQKSQKQYFDLIKSYEKQVFSDEINQKQIAMIIDEIQSFWLDRKDILIFEFENLTVQRECFMLSGAVYLNIQDNEHYVFKGIGEEHIISEPLLKLENFFRVSKERFSKESIEIFRRAFRDVLTILSEYQNVFYILPIHTIAIENEKKHHELLQKYFLSFLNSVLNEDFQSFDDFFDKYNTYDEIERDIVPLFKTSFTFGMSDKNAPLSDKIETYINSQSILLSMTKNKDESEKFLLVLQSYLMQIIDILLISSITNTIPFIRCKTTFQYLLIVMYTFIEDKYFKDMIEKTIVSYIFSNTVNKEKLVKIDFDKYLEIIKKEDFLGEIIEEMNKKGIDIFKTGIKETGAIIEEIFCNTINKKPL
jgi:hypothetical protein